MTSVKNEAPFLLEWIAYYQALGITDFLIYSNDCEDSTDALLNILADAGIITHIPQLIEGDASPQWQALNHAWKHELRKKCDWAIVCDVDEFINIHIGDGTFESLINALPDEADGIMLPWRLFGSSGHIEQAKALTIEAFTHSMSAQCNYPIEATFFKTLFNLKGPFNQFGVHRPKQKKPEKSRLPVWVDGSGNRLPEWFSTHVSRLSLYGLPQSRLWAECHHYSLRSAQSFMCKRSRGLPNRSNKNIDLSYWVGRNFNTIENRSILKMLAQTHVKITALRAVEGVRKCEENGLEWHRQKFLGLLEDMSEFQLYDRISVAGSTQEVEPHKATHLISFFQRAYKIEQEQAKE